ncbi:MAG TPA: hypothetical protein VK705_04265 [Ferruginibacter sp.]|jgi:hypothetical protein|nr:hypothetical protein [Ferruginibacter sp.]
MDNYDTRIIWSQPEYEIPKDIYPKYPLKEYEIWEEGYSATGEHGGAIFLGKSIGRSFKEACCKLMCEKHLEYLKEVQSDEYNGYDNPNDGWSYDPSTNTKWGCHLFDNEVDARKSFG